MKNNIWMRGLSIAWCSALASMALAQSAAPPPAPETADKAAEQANAPKQGDKTPYFVASQVDWVPLLPPPPAANSPEQQRDVQAVLDAQAANRKGARRELAIKDVEASCARIAEVLGTDLDEKKLPKSSAFLKKAASEADSAAGVVKSYWKRPRPYIASNKVERIGDMAPDYLQKKQQEQKEKEQKEKEQKEKEQAANGNSGGMGAGPPPGGGGGPPPGAGPNNRPGNRDGKPADPEEEKKKLAEQQKAIDNSSYPSGHATFGTLCAIFLAQMVPEKQAELFARAEEYRQSRLIVGAHFRSDIEAGRALGTAAAAIISQNFAFQRDLAAARSELRAALNLPAELPAPPNAEKEKEAEGKK